MIGAARIKGFDLPEAVAAPNGMPAVASEAHEAANGQLLWRALRETIRHSVQPVRGEERDGVLGWLWRGNPQQIAEAMWDGLDRSQLADETLAALYAYLHRVRQLTRTDTGNKGREWWVAVSIRAAGQLPSWTAGRSPRPQRPTTPPCSKVSSPSTGTWKPG